MVPSRTPCYLHPLTLCLLLLIRPTVNCCPLRHPPNLNSSTITLSQARSTFTEIAAMAAETGWCPRRQRCNGANQAIAVLNIVDTSTWADTASVLSTCPNSSSTTAPYVHNKTGECAGLVREIRWVNGDGETNEWHYESYLTGSVMHHTGCGTNIVDQYQRSSKLV